MPRLDLMEVGGDIFWLRGTLRLGQRAPQVNVAQATRARQVAQGRGRTDQQTTLTATWRVKGDTPAECMTRVDQFLAAVDSGRVDRYLEWRPDGAPASSFMRIVGPGTYNPLYEWVQFVGATGGPGMNIDVSWPIEPFARAPGWDVVEEWETPPAKPGGYVNEIFNPRAALDTRGMAEYTASANGLLRDTAWPTNGTSFRTAGTLASNTFAGLTVPQAIRSIPVTPGDKISATVDYNIITKPATNSGILQFYLRFWKVNAINSDVIVNVSGIVNGATGVIQHENVTVPAGVTHVTPIVGMSGITGETWDFKFTNVAVYKAASLPVYNVDADGYADGDDEWWAWKGAAHYSPSYETIDAKLAEWTVDVDTARAAVRGVTDLSFRGVGATQVETRLRHTGRNTGPRVNDEVFVNYQSGNTFSVRVWAMLSATSANYYQAGITSSVLTIQRVQDGTPVNVGTTAAAAPTAGSNYSLRFSRDGNVLTAVAFDRDGVTPLGTATYTLTGQEVNAFIRGGDAGLRVEGTTTQGVRIYGWTRRPNTWRFAGLLPDTFPIPDLPGSSEGPPHFADISIQPTTQTAAWAFGLLAWTRKCGVENLVWNGDFERDGSGWAAGGAGPDGGTALLGVATGAIVSRGTSVFSRYGQGLNIITADGQVANQANSFKLYRKFRRGQTYSLVVWARLRESFIAAPVGVTATPVAGGTLAAQTWRYKVAALNAAGQSIASLEVSAVTAGGNLTVRLAWGAVPGATGYRVYRSDTAVNAEDEYKDVGNVTTWDDTGAAGWTAGTPVAIATGTVAGSSINSQIALGFDSTDRSILTFSAGSAQMEQRVVEWTPTADRDYAIVGIVTHTAAGVAVRLDTDAISVYEGLEPPEDIDHLQGRGALRPFGRLAARADYRTARTGTWVTNGTDALSLVPIAPTGGTARLEWLVDPFLIDVPEEERDPVVEAYLHLIVSSGFAGLRAVASVAPIDVAGGRQYAAPFGSPGRPIVVPVSGTPERTTRLGQLTLERDSLARGRVSIRVDFTWTSVVGPPALIPQYLFLSPITAVASTPTGKQNDTKYPVIVPAQGAGMEPNVRVVQADLTGLIVGARTLRGGVDSSLGGDPIELPPGDALLSAWVNSGVPDDPTINATSHADVTGGVVHAAITPRHNLVVPGR